nr:hypothetical protein [Rickettsia conorii]
MSCSSSHNTVKLPKIEYYENISLNKNCPINSEIVLVGGCFDLLHYGHIEFTVI